MPAIGGHFASLAEDAGALYPTRDHKAYPPLWAVRQDKRQRDRHPTLTRHEQSVITTTMPTAKMHKTMTELLREALTEAASIRGVAKEIGLDHSSLVRFVNGEQSLRLDLADKLAAHFHIVCIRKGNMQ
jgi:hypothetical protein